jgi:hypothetical protein
MAVFSIACIVEGHGEVPAVPILIRRLVELVNPAMYANVQRPIRQPRGTLLREGGIEGAVDLAVRGLPESGFVLIIIDSDDSCPKDLAPKMLARALQTAARRRPVGVVLAKREFESWFIAAAESIAGHAGLSSGLCAPSDQESIRDAKGWLQKAMPPRTKYSETVDQPSLASKFDLTAARRAPSFDKMYREIERFCSLAITV